MCVLNYDLHQLVPHRGTMLLLDRALEVSATEAKAIVSITPESSFYMPVRGVPSWIGLEYMGQTAAMIAGLQMKQNQLEPHMGMLLGTRKYNNTVPWFALGSELEIHCWEHAVAAGGLAMFCGQIREVNSGEVLASAKLTVYRKPLSEPSGKKYE